MKKNDLPGADNSGSRVAAVTKNESVLSCATDSNNEKIYIFGIIDILQEYNFGKKAEHCSKVVLRCKNSRGISAIEPYEYWQRFNDKMGDIIL